jgi:RIO kinase 3
MDRVDRERNTIGGSSKLTLTMQRQHTSSQPEPYRAATSSEEEQELEQDIFGEVESKLRYDKTTKCMRGEDGRIFTKHDTATSGRLNRQRIDSQFPLGFKSGDLKGSGGREIRVDNGVYNKLKRFAVKDAKRSARLHEKKDNSTALMALDRNTRLIVFKMVNGGLLESVFGAVSTGKESVIFAAEARDRVGDEEDATLAQRVASGHEDELEEMESVESVVDSEGEGEGEGKGMVDDGDDGESEGEGEGETEVASASEGASSAVQHVGEPYPVALKVFKTTLTEFTQRQQFLHGDPRYESRVGRQHARKLVKVWAEKEYANLHRMHRAGMNSPVPLFQRQHVLAMTMIGSGANPAPKLKDVRWSKTLLKSCFAQLRDQMSIMYHECRLVHCDLSEYNVLWHDSKPWIIDVGQSVEVTHPRSLEYLYRDCVNVVRFFNANGYDKAMVSAPRLYEFIVGEAISSEQMAEFSHKIATPGRGSIKAHEKAVDAEETSNVVLRFAQPITAATLATLDMDSAEELEDAGVEGDE